jgi:hypothetical protein
MAVHEPMTFATDLVLGAVALGLALPLLTSRDLRGRARRLWGWALVLTGVGAWTGGFWHGFGPEIQPGGATLLWKVTIFAIGAAGATMLAGAAIATLRPPLRTALLVGVGLKLALYVAWMSRHDDFRYVIYDYAPAMALVLLLELVALARGRGRGAGWIIVGILLSFTAAAIQRTEMSFAANFNANDLYHLVQIGALFLLFLGARRLEDA